MRKFSNRELIHGIVNGNIAASNAFHDKYSRRIIRWVWRLLGSDREHDDVVQQVYTSIFRSIRNIRQPESLDGWVNRVTIMTVKYELRRRVARRARIFYRDSRDLDEFRERRSPFKERHIKIFYSILDNMPADDRIVFVLRYMEGYKIDEIATIMACSPSTVKRRLARSELLFTKMASSDFRLVSLVEEYHAV